MNAGAVQAIPRSKVSFSSSLRKFVSVGIGLVFLVVGATGVIFQFFFKNRQLESIHGWLGVVMVAVAVIHVVQNWKPLAKYLTDFRVYVLIIPLALVMGFLGFGQREQQRGLNPRMVMSKISGAKADDLARALGKDPEAVLADLRKQGISASSRSLTLEEIAKQNGKPADAILGAFLK